MNLYNTLTRQKEEFVPQTPGKASMYVCGITAYDYCHIGHARSAVVFDVLARYLKHTGLDVTFIRNFTDVDDKIINRANEVGAAPADLAEKFIRAFYEDMDVLDVQRPDVEPRATEHIPEMIELTRTLIERGHAYPTPSGDVYFKVRSFEGYGLLSGRNVEELKSGARIAPGEEKQDPLDFALWKASKPGEPSWPSPWGEGRPGWHIECSAMSAKYADLPLDIHGGGQDLAFPHHENERAQSEAAAGKTFARYWVHNGFVSVNQEKMSKSLGNFVTIREIYKHYLPEVLRFFLLTKHYRSPLDYSTEALDEAEKALRRIYAGKVMIEDELARTKWSQTALPADLTAELDKCLAGISEAMEDDLNTAAALGHIFTMVRLAGRVQEDKSLRKSQGARQLWTEILKALDAWGGVLGLFTKAGRDFLERLRDMKLRRRGLDKSEIEALVAERGQARKAKDFARADAIRDKLAEMGVEVHDTPAGATWDVV